jgi:hypothetical protein
VPHFNSPLIAGSSSLFTPSSLFAWAGFLEN